MNFAADRLDFRAVELAADRCTLSGEIDNVIAGHRSDSGP
jgi:hypothetical protein